MEELVYNRLTAEAARLGGIDVEEIENFIDQMEQANGDEVWDDILDDYHGHLGQALDYVANEFRWYLRCAEIQPKNGFKS